MRKWILLFSFLNLPVVYVNATHIVGGQLNYTYLGNYEYRITLTLYRDCYNGIPPFDNPASIGVFDVNNTYLFQLLLPFTGSDTIPPAVSTPCLTPPVNICYETTTYVDTVLLPPIIGGYQLSYQRCCRNQTILNIVSPVTTGSTYYASLPLDTSHAINSNPEFSAWPPPFICAGVPFEFDHSAIDIEGDSLIYEICTPLSGGTTTNPIPQPPFSPPYFNVIWQAPYSLNNVMSGVPLSIDPTSGLLTVTPATIGQFVIGVCVTEYRNGVPLSTTRRDYQLNVVPCPFLVVSSFQDIVSCGSNTVQFNNLSGGAVNYFWDFGDNNSTTDTSTLFNPIYSYTDTGMYTVTLIGYSSISQCHDTAFGTVHILPEYITSFSYQKDTCSYMVQFTDTFNNNGSGETMIWNWEFGDNQSSTQHNPSHLYTQAGTYPFTLISQSQFGCTDTIQDTLHLSPILNVTINSSQMPLCHSDCNGSANVLASGGNAPYAYIWNDPMNQTTSLASNLCAGAYTVQITDSLGCKETVSVFLNEPDSLQAILTASEAYCGGWCIGTASALPIGGNAPYSFLWNDPNAQSNATATQLCPGYYTIWITDSNACTYTDSILVISSNSLPGISAIASQDTILVGNSVTLSAIPSTAYNSYEWLPTGIINQPNNAITLANPQQSTMFYILITDSNGCSNMDSVFITVLNPLCTEPEIFVPNTFSPNNDGINDVVYVRGRAISELTFAIYNRWGEKVFETNNPQEGWNGTFKGNQMAPQVFVYYVDIRCYNGESFFKKGNITLVR